MAEQGCGPTACANVIANISNSSVTPKETRKFMLDKGYAIRNNGTAWAGIPACLKNWGYTVTDCPNMSTVWAQCEKGAKYGVILFRSGSRGGVTWTSGGHFVAFTDYKVEKGRHYLYTRDSGSRKNDGWHCYETQMSGLIPAIWTCKPANPPKVTCTITYNANGGNGAPGKQTYTYAETGTTTLSSKIPTAGSAYKFLGWSLSNNTDKPSYSAGQKWALNNKGNYTLYAVWKKTENPYKGAFPTGTVRQGDTGENVKRVQLFMNWMYGNKLTVDGICGPKTVEMIKKFQASRGLTADGICGPKTIAEMKAVK